MMRFAIVENGVVTNVVVASVELAIEKGWVRTDEAGPGWAYNGTNFVAPPQPPPPPPPPDPRAPLLADLDVKLAALVDGPIKDVLVAVRKAFG